MRRKPNQYFESRTAHLQQRLRMCRFRRFGGVVALIVLRFNPSPSTGPRRLHRRDRTQRRPAVRPPRPRCVRHGPRLPKSGCVDTYTPEHFAVLPRLIVLLPLRTALLLGWAALLFQPMPACRIADRHVPTRAGRGLPRCRQRPGTHPQQRRALLSWNGSFEPPDAVLFPRRSSDARGLVCDESCCRWLSASYRSGRPIRCHVDRTVSPRTRRVPGDRLRRRLVAGERSP